MRQEARSGQAPQGAAELGPQSDGVGYRAVDLPAMECRAIGLGDQRVERQAVPVTTLVRYDE